MAPDSKGKDKDFIKKGAMKFIFFNGDTYDGEYVANLKLKTISMNGLGTYKTPSGEVYEGNWINDKLSNNDKHSITYPDNNSYFGLLNNHQYSVGTYSYFDGSTISGTFAKNLPNDVVFIDPNRHIWNVQVSDNIVYLSTPIIFNLDNQKVNEEHMEEECKNEDDDDDDDDEIENDSVTAISQFPKKKGIF